LRRLMPFRAESESWKSQPIRRRPLWPGTQHRVSTLRSSVHPGL